MKLSYSLKYIARNCEISFRIAIVKQNRCIFRPGIEFRVALGQTSIDVIISLGLRYVFSAFRMIAVGESGFRSCEIISVRARLLSRRDTKWKCVLVAYIYTHTREACTCVLSRAPTHAYTCKESPLLDAAYVGRTWCHIERESRYRYAIPGRTGTRVCACARARKLRGPAKRWPYILFAHYNTYTYIYTYARKRYANVS